MKKVAIFTFTMLLALPGLARTPDYVPPPIKAVLTDETIKIDGQLDEKVWQNPGFADFIQTDPTDGADPSEKTKVWVVYDQKSLYIAALLSDSEKEKITTRVGRRDEFVDSDWFIFAVDPYLDRRSGYKFAVNPSGSICDWTLSNDNWSDSTWDGIWEAKTAINDKGWVVEMKIPFHQLRFQRRVNYIWGIDFQRIIKRKNEFITYAWRPKEQVGYVSHFAQLEGISGISPRRYFEFLPYLVGQARFQSTEPGNPFRAGSSFLANTGLDLKVGLNSNLTIDATFNPDFGQVEVDPAVINLSAYEIYYEERRPFFIEGARIFDGFGQGVSQGGPLFDWPSPTFFYSRRIGRAPQINIDSSGYIDIPGSTTILGAAKLTGRIGGDWNFGFLSGLTAREYARIDDGGFRSSREVEPFTYYGVLRAQKEFKNGRHSLGFIVTTVQRDLDAESLSTMLNKNALALGIDGWTFLDSRRNWFITGWLGGTRVSGEASEILNLRKSSMHYYQRPDAPHLRLDPDATSLSGWGGMIRFGKEQGRFWMHVNLGGISPGFDPNDTGFQFGSSDVITSSVDFAYRWPHPGKTFRSVFAWIGTYYNCDFGGTRTGSGIAGSFQTEWLNYWNSSIDFSISPSNYSITLTRGGPKALIPFGYSLYSGITSDSRKKIVFHTCGNFSKYPGISQDLGTHILVTFKPQKNLSFSIGPTLTFYRTELQYLKCVNDPRMAATYGNRYIFGRIDQKTLACELRLDWSLSPRLSLQAYLHPFISVGVFDRIKQLARPQSNSYMIYGDGDSTLVNTSDGCIIDPDGTGPAAPFSLADPDFNMKSLRGTVVLRWEYRPGSLLYLVWTQNRNDFTHPGDLQLGRDLGDLFTAPGDNILMLKFTYRLDW